MNPKYIFNTERVYLRLGRDYFNQEIRSIRPLFNLTAKCVGQDDEGKPLCSFVDKTNKWFIYEGRTKNYIVKKTNEYLSGFGIILSNGEEMKPIASKRQLRFLLLSDTKNNKTISCYCLILIYIMLLLVHNNSKDYEEEISKMDIKECISSYCNIVKEYYKYNKNNELAHFLIECYSTIEKHFECPDNKKWNVKEIPEKDFPPILRKTLNKNEKF